MFRTRGQATAGLETRPRDRPGPAGTRSIHLALALLAVLLVALTGAPPAAAQAGATLG